jgi:broad specificity phosphatase PhoE
MSQILSLRHSKTIANAEGLMAGGLTDSKLNSEGKALAHVKGAELRKLLFTPATIYCSTLVRTSQTAEIFLEELGIKREIKVDARLNERYFGKYDGQPFDHLMQAFEEYGPNPPTVEPVDTFLDRTRTVFDAIGAEDTGDVLIVTHVNVLAAIHCYLFEPKRLSEFWETYRADYCDGFTYDM